MPSSVLVLHASEGLSAPQAKRPWSLLLLLFALPPMFASADFSGDPPPPPLQLLLWFFGIGYTSAETGKKRFRMSTSSTEFRTYQSVSCRRRRPTFDTVFAFQRRAAATFSQQRLCTSGLKRALSLSLPILIQAAAVVVVAVVRPTVLHHHHHHCHHWSSSDSRRIYCRSKVQHWQLLNCPRKKAPTETLADGWRDASVHCCRRRRRQS